MANKPPISDYIKTLGVQVKNQQKLLSYFVELYEFYNDKLPNNKYIYYLDENPYTEPFSNTSPEVFEFFSATPLQLNLLTPSIRIFKRFKKKGQVRKKIEIPFENRMDFESFQDPAGFIGGETDFITERFMGPVVGLKSLDITHTGAANKAIIPSTTNIVRVNLTLAFQDIKMLFKNLDPIENVKYKDIFASPGGSSYDILLELGYNIPDNFDPLLNKFAQKKLIIILTPNAPSTQITYNNDGSAEISTRLDGRVEALGGVNLLDSKYYKAIKRNKNMRLIEDEEQYSADTLASKITSLEKLKQRLDKKHATDSPTDQESNVPNIDKLEKDVQRLQRKVQLAKQAGAVPSIFPFITALYELGKIYYIELDNQTYSSYIKKVAQGQPVDVTNLKVVPNRKHKLKQTPEDIIQKLKSKTKNKTDYTAGTLRIRSFNTEETSTKFEKVKFFYFGDLLDIILNNQKGGGVGQDLDLLGKSASKFLLGPTLWIKNKDLKKIYNIANTPISLDMFLFELNKEIVSKKLKFFSIRQFFADFMKSFFDTLVLSAEKEKTGKDQQAYSGKVSYTLDLDKINQTSKFVRSMSNFTPDSDSVNVTDFVFIGTFLNNVKSTKKIRKQRNIPTVFLGGPNVGPFEGIKFETFPVTGIAEREAVRQFKLNKGTENSIGDTSDDSIMITNRVKANLSLKGNPFFSVMDRMFIDTRFVDGGYFQQHNNLMFFTGLFYIYGIKHSIVGNTWKSAYDLGLVTASTDITPTFNAYLGEMPLPPEVSLVEETKKNNSKKKSGKSPDSKT